MNHYYHRHIEQVLQSAIKEFPALIITGPRLSVKTTLLQHCFGNTHRYVSLDNPDVRVFAQKDAALFLQNYPPPVIIDEIQYVPDLLTYIKILIDKDRLNYGRFLFTGSQVFPLMAGVSETLAGRIAIFNLLGFSLREKFIHTTQIGLEELKHYILFGGFPELALNPARNVSLWLSSYLQTYLERDVRQLRNVADLSDFQRFLYLLAGYNGGILSLSKIANDLGVSVNTIKAWLSILEATAQIMLIKPYYHNKGKRIIKSPKIYWLDTGLLCHLLGISSVEQIVHGPHMGQLLETVVLQEYLKSCYAKGTIPQIYWWRTSSGEEVDFIIEQQGKLIPLEVKYTTHITPSMAKHLKHFCTLFSGQIEKALLINLSQERFIVDEKISSVSIFDFICGL